MTHATDDIWICWTDCRHLSIRIKILWYKILIVINCVAFLWVDEGEKNTHQYVMFMNIWKVQISKKKNAYIVCGCFVVVIVVIVVVNIFNGYLWQTECARRTFNWKSMFFDMCIKFLRWYCNQLLNIAVINEVFFVSLAFNVNTKNNKKKNEKSKQKKRTYTTFMTFEKASQREFSFINTKYEVNYISAGRCFDDIDIIKQCFNGISCIT